MVSVAVIGSGPSGALFSLLASRLGFDVLVVERKSKPSSNIVCGEFLLTPEETRRLYIDSGVIPDIGCVDESYRYIDGGDVVENKISLIEIYLDGGRLFLDIKLNGYVIRKDLMIQKIVDEAERNGVKLVNSAFFIDARYRDGGVLLKARRGCSDLVFEANYVIGADSTPSRVAQVFGINSGYDDRDIALCINQRFSNLKFDECKVYVFISPRYAPGGFGWIIPKGGGRANVGLGVRMHLVKKGLRIVDCFRKFISDVEPTFLKGAKPIESFYLKTVPVGGIVENVEEGNVMLIGDAAGTCEPINGAGIVNAMISGCIASNCLKSIVDDGSLSYSVELRRVLGRVVENGLLYRKIGDLLMYDEKLIRLGALFLGKKVLRKVLKAEKTPHLILASILGRVLS
jgi:digeranylgeranylglycerophospholipid reductase